jgi:hypothetical protein
MYIKLEKFTSWSLRKQLVSFSHLSYQKALFDNFILLLNLKKFTIFFQNTKDKNHVFESLILKCQKNYDNFKFF